MIHSRWRSTLLAFGLVVALSACGGSGAPSTTNGKVDLKIMVGGLSKQIYLPNMLAEKLGFFGQENLNVTLIDEASGQSSEQQVLTGDVQAGSGSYNHTVELLAQGKQMTEVVQLGIAPGEGLIVASSKAGEIKSASDFKGRNMGVTELGSGTQTLTTVIAAKNGVSQDQMHFVPVGAGSTFIAGMQQGKIDAGMTTEPTISQVVGTGLGKVLYDLRTPSSSRQALGGDYPFICLFMSSDYVKNHGDVTQRLVNAYVKTLKWINTHSAQEVADKMPADYYAGNKASYITALEGQKAMFSPDGKMPSGGPAFVLKTEQMTNPDIKGKDLDLSKTFTNQFVNKAA